MQGWQPERQQKIEWKGWGAALLLFILINFVLRSMPVSFRLALILLGSLLIYEWVRTQQGKLRGVWRQFGVDFLQADRILERMLEEKKLPYRRRLDVDKVVYRLDGQLDVELVDRSSTESNPQTAVSLRPRHRGEAVLMESWAGKIAFALDPPAPDDPVG